MDRQFSMDSIETLVEERPVIARLLVGTIGATAALMIISISWAQSDASVVWLLLAGIAIAVSSTLVVVSALPIECKIGPYRRSSIPCRLQNRRLIVDTIAFAIALLVIVNIFVRSV